MARVTIEVEDYDLGDFTMAVDETGTISTTPREDIEVALLKVVRRVRQAYGIDD